jgi:hypothetical protein
MKKQTNFINIFSNPNEFFYRIVMPVVVVILLLIVSQGIARPLFFGSSIVDLLIRVWLCLCYCSGYIILSNLRKYESWFYQRRNENTNVQNDPVTRVWYVGMGIMSGLFSVLISWWTVKAFLPNLNNFIWFIAIINGLLFSLPVVIQNRNVRF